MAAPQGNTLSASARRRSLCAGVGAGDAQVQIAVEGVYCLRQRRPLVIHVAQVTIAGTVAPGTAFDPDAIAEAYWSLYAQPREAWTAEQVFTGQSG